MGRDRAAYMREYRAKRKDLKFMTAREFEDKYVAGLEEKVSALEEEVRHLKAELAKRPVVEETTIGRYPATVRVQSYSTRPFTPAPKRSKS